MMAGERSSDPKASDDRRAIQNSSGRLPKVDTEEIIPNLVEEVTPDHIEMVVDLEEEAEASPLHKRIEAPTLALAPEIEKSRQKDQSVIWSRKLKVSRKKLEVLRRVLGALKTWRKC